MSRWNCNILGGYMNGIIQGCFDPSVTVYIFRDASPEVEELYYGEAASVPNLQGLRVVDIQYDDYNYVFSIEVK